MRWEWDNDGDDRVAEMWHLMKKLSDCKKVVYSKWYQGRATFFSRDLFCAMLCLLHRESDPYLGLSPTAKRILDTLESDSPLSTKQLKLQTDLQGKFNEGLYNKSLKELFLRFLIVGFGEVDDGAFPSLAVGATSLLYEDLLLEAKQMPLEKATILLNKNLPLKNHFRNNFEKVRKTLTAFTAKHSEATI